MLRICGITYVRTTNYGSCFQAYALQKAIDKMIVGDGERCKHQFLALWRCDGHFSSSPSRLFYRMVLHRFEAFQEKEIDYTDCERISDLPMLNERFDAFVCGSDVIWQSKFNHQLGLYYLDFANKYKFSYAPSFGRSTVEDAFFQVAGKWIAELSDISVREQSSVDIVKRYAGRDAQVVADPVVLLTQEDWNQVAGNKKAKKGYIFSYTTHYTAEYEQFLRKLSDNTGLRIVRASWITSKKDALKQGILIVQQPEKWLQQLRDAEFVVTNSFHATVFSSIFHKKFFTVVHGNKNESFNFRMYDFLNTIGLSDRMFSEVPDTIDLSDIDFTQSDKIMGEMRNEGLNYLKRNLEAAYAQKKAE